MPGNPRAFLEQTKHLSAVANDPTVPIKQRLESLCTLYRWYQCDVHNQAKCITRLEELIKQLP